MRVRGAAAGLAAACAAACAVSAGCGAAASGRTAALARPHTARAGPSPATRTASPLPSPQGSRAPVTPRRQLVTVTAASAGATYAVLTAYASGPDTGGRWRRVLGPWTARLGNGGLAPPGQKREGDGRTPSGTYGFGFFFGTKPNPGVAFPYRQSQPYDMWDDDPASPRYNEWVDDRTQDPGADPEPMFVSGYDYGAVIAYNTAGTPGLGSAIFLHVNIGQATTGCVTLPAGELLTVLRWLRPADSPRIRLAVSATG
jgi:L,D-peptidoglycan transpeptidase YkuD (ErfK/YbiS/YcfS/YnhG family)